MFNFRYLFLLTLIFFSSGVFAEYYRFQTDTIHGVTGRGSSLNAAYSSSYLAGYSYRIDKVQHGQNTVTFLVSALSNHSNPDGSRAVVRSFSITRYGNRCPADTTYDEQLHECKAPASSPQSFEFLFCYNYDGGDGCAPGTNKGRPDSFCKNGIQFSADYNPSTTDASCYSYRNGDGTSGPAIMCSVTGTPTDQSCKTDYKTDTPDNSCPAGTVGGEVNNKRVCIPSGTGGGDGDGGEDGDNSGDGDGDGDGSGGETGGDGDGNGSDGDGDGTGSGGNSGGGGDGGGGSNGGGDGNGDGNGTGNGSGNGTGDGEGEGEEEGIGSGQGVEFCESGRCEFGDEKSDFFDGEVRTYSESMSAIFEGMQNSPLNSAISNIKFPEGGTCPTGSMSIDIGIGVIPLTFEEHCNFWEQISPVLSAAFLALWSVIAVRVFLSA